ncbi:hypothetical protein N326_03478, partial [Eurypyga helias]
MGLFIGFPPLDLPLCNTVCEAEIQSLVFSSSPSGTSLRIICVLESALRKEIHINSYKEVPNPSNKFGTGIPFFSILQEGFGSLKHLYTNFRLYPHPMYVLNSYLFP